jgi:hypothetical protein
VVIAPVREHDDVYVPQVDPKRFGVFEKYLARPPSVEE